MSSQIEDAFNEAVERRASGYEQRIAALDDLVQRAWRLIAGAMSGNPHKPTANSEWMDAAHAWEIDYCMGAGLSGKTNDEKTGECRAPHCWSEYGTPCATCPAATPDQPTDAHRPWPIAPDTVMPPRRQPIRWGSRADDPPTEIHDDPQRTKAYLAGLAAGRTEAAVASPDERLREALREIVRQVEEYPALSPTGIMVRDDIAGMVEGTARAALAATDRDKPEANDG